MKALQQSSLVCSRLNRGSVAGHGEVFLDLFRPGETNPRYTVNVLDQPYAKETGRRFAAFIVPQGRQVFCTFFINCFFLWRQNNEFHFNHINLCIKQLKFLHALYRNVSHLNPEENVWLPYYSCRETEWLFATPEGRSTLLKSAGFDRLAVVSLHRDQTYKGLDAVQEELTDSILHLAPPGLLQNAQVIIKTIRWVKNLTAQISDYDMERKFHCTSLQEEWLTCPESFWISGVRSPQSRFKKNSVTFYKLRNIGLDGWSLSFRLSAHNTPLLSLCQLIVMEPQFLKCQIYSKMA